MAIGTPANGRSSPGSIVSATARAPSASTSTNALIRPSRSSIRSSDSVTTSRARSSPPRTWAASSPTVMDIRSLIRGRQPRSSGRSVKIPRSRSSMNAPSNRLRGYDQVMVPEVPDGPLGSGAPYWYWLGGRPALDLVNTRRERWRRNIECLVTDRDAVDWLVAARLLPDEGPVARGLAREACELREAIDAGVRAAVAGEAADTGALR